MKHKLALDFVEHSFGKRKILSNVSFVCYTGDILAIFGRNGSGKSTLLKILFGALRANHFGLSFDGKNVRRISPKDMRIAYLPQDPFLPQGLKVRDIIPMYYPDGDAQDKIFHAAYVSHFEKQKIGALSPGQQKYLEFLLIVNLGHPFIMLDEPFSMIEPLYKDQIKKTIIEQKVNKGFIITDHYYFDVLEVASKSIIIKNGSSVDVQSTNDLIDQGYLSGINRGSKNT